MFQVILPNTWVSWFLIKAVVELTFVHLWNMKITLLWCLCCWLVALAPRGLANLSWLGCLVHEALICLAPTSFVMLTYNVLNCWSARKGALSSWFKCIFSSVVYDNLQAYLCAHNYSFHMLNDGVANTPLFMYLGSWDGYLQVPWPLYVRSRKHLPQQGWDFRCKTGKDILICQFGIEVML